MKKVAVFVLLICLLPARSAYAAPNYDDYFRPIIDSLNVEIPVVAKSKADGGYTYPLVAKVELTVRVHSNTLTGFRISLRNKNEVPLATPCQSLNNVKISIGNSDYQGGEGNLQPLVGLISKSSDKDWMVEKYKFEIQVPSNSFLKPCVGTYEPEVIHLRDIASHHKSILINYGTPVPFYESLGRFDSDWRKLPLPENSCPLTTSSEFRSMPTACVEKISPSALSRSFTVQEIEQAEIAESKRLVDLKAKQEAEAKAAADLKAKKEVEAATALKAKQDADARAAANKKISITCIKGKVTKIVTALKPKCPTGYKLKK